MIKRQMTPLEWSIPAYTKDSYGQELPSFTSQGTIDVAVYFDAQLFKQNPQWAEATHVGLTKNKSIHVNDTIGTYKVLQTNPIGRYNQLILKEV